MRLKYFSKREFTCSCGCGKTIISDELLELLDEARELAKIPFVITSGYRCENHFESKLNPKSSHIKGLAVDIKCKDSKTRALMINALGFVGLAGRMGISDSFIHVDIDYEDKPSPVIWLYN